MRWHWHYTPQKDTAECQVLSYSDRKAYQRKRCANLVKRRASLLHNAMSIIKIASGESCHFQLESLSTCSLVANAKNPDIVVLSQLEYKVRNANRRDPRNLPLLASRPLPQVYVHKSTRSHLIPHSFLQRLPSCCNSYYVFANLALSRSRGSRSRTPTPFGGDSGSSGNYPRKSFYSYSKHWSFSNLECHQILQLFIPS